MFLEGDSNYVVEEKTYHLVPEDIIIIRKHEMHRVCHNSLTKYHSFVLWVSPDFFQAHGCADYEAAFLGERFSSSNKINAEVVHSSGLYDAIERLKKYSQNGTVKDSPVVYSSIVEILYLINNISSFEEADSVALPVKPIIDYINHHFTSEIRLDTLCDLFFISKYHLCRIFKQATGLTVQNYIRRKRLAFAMERKREGQSLTEAAIAAGFNDYSSFYRAYVKEYHQSPQSKVTP